MKTGVPVAGAIISPLEDGMRIASVAASLY